MSNTSSLTPKELIRILQQKQLGKRAIVPMHNKDLKKGTFFSVLKQAGIDKREL